MSVLRTLLLPEVRFISAIYALLLVVFAVLRGMLLWRNHLQAAGISTEILAESFLVGLRFDLAISSYLLIPLFLLLLVVPRQRHKMLVYGFCALVGALILFGLAEIEFYRELEMRFNTLVFEYLSHPTIVAGMIWEGYPVFRYLLLWILLMVFLCAGAAWAYRKSWPGHASPVTVRWSLSRAAVAGCVLVVMVIGARGGLASQPLRWGDAFFCEDAFANNLALNGVYTLGRSALEKMYGSQ